MPDKIFKIETPVAYYCVKLLCFILLVGFLACVFFDF